MKYQRFTPKLQRFSDRKCEFVATTQLVYNLVSYIVLDKSEQSLEYKRMPEDQYSPNLGRVDT